MIRRALLRRTDGGATDTFSICVNTSAPAWDTPTY